jgi:hypothetical protein
MIALDREWTGRWAAMRNLLNSGKAVVVTRVLGSASALTVLVAVLAAGRKWN